VLKTFINLFKNKEIRNKIFFTLAMLLVYRLGAGIPAPRVDAVKLLASVSQNSIIQMMNLLGGGSLQDFSVFALGVGPYITASIIVQLLSMDVIPYLTELAKSGQKGKMQMDKITRYLAVILAFVQAFTMTYAFDVSSGIIVNGNVSVYLYVATVLTAGTMFLCWLGDRISAKGIGNGISMIIFTGIVANMPWQFVRVYQELTLTNPAGGLLIFVGYIFMYLMLIIMVIFMSQATRRIPIQYTSSSVQKGRSDMTFLPLKINSASVIPVIFASALMTAPRTILSFFPTNNITSFLDVALDYTQPWGLLLYVVMVIMFTFFYTSLQVDPEKIADNLSKNGSYVPGVRPGNETKKYISVILNRITVLGALSLAFIAALPFLLPMITPLPASVALGGTGIIIVVGVALETMKDLSGQLTQRSYRGFTGK
jgi:preprotein translocase subunit SecY